MTQAALRLALRPPHFDLSYSGVSDRDFQDIGKVLLYHDKIESIDLRGNNLTGIAIGYLSYALYGHQHVQRIDLGFNRVGRTRGFEVFCQAMESLRCLEELRLRSCELTSLHCSDLSLLIRRSKTLRSIDMSWNFLGNAGGMLLLDGLRKSTTRSVVELRLVGSEISDPVLADIQFVLHANGRAELPRPWAKGRYEGHYEAGASPLEVLVSPRGGARALPLPGDQFMQALVSPARPEDGMAAPPRWDDPRAHGPSYYDALTSPRDPSAAAVGGRAAGRWGDYPDPYPDHPHHPADLPAGPPMYRTDLPPLYPAALAPGGAAPDLPHPGHGPEPGGWWPDPHPAPTSSWVAPATGVPHQEPPLARGPASPGRGAPLGPPSALLDKPQYLPALFDVRLKGSLAPQLDAYLLGARFAPTLDLGDKHVGNFGAYRVSRFVLDHPFADEVILRNNDITGEGARFLADALKSPAATIRRLDLSQNRVGSLMGFDVFCRVLERNMMLVELNLADNFLGPKDGKALGTMIAGNRKLKVLDLRGNRLEALGGEQVCSGIEGNPVLVTLKMEGCEVPLEVQREILRCLERNAFGTW
mmetsp:Transcript_45770/g.103615  ORF Transcript_45770/g.103615 Transcript_45770/m.103615 type:complete len:586 (+) Transcript_45770:59-1816(+)